MKLLISCIPSFPHSHSMKARDFSGAWEQFCPDALPDATSEFTGWSLVP